MKRNYFIQGAAVLTLCLMAASCKNHDESLYQPTPVNKEATYAESFVKEFGEVNANQDWRTVEGREAEVKVNLGLDQNYTVAVYTENPLFVSNTSLLALTKVQEGGTGKLSFAAPAAASVLYVGVFDSKGRGVTESAMVKNGKISVSVGSNSATRMNRAIEADYVGLYAKTAADYLDGITVAEMQAYYGLTNNVIENETNDGHTLSNGGKWDWSQEEGSFQHTFGTDNKHFFVASGTEVTSKFDINGTWGVTNDAVIYVEGKLHLGTNYTLNSVTIVVGDGGEVVLDGEVNMSNSGRFVVLAGGKVSGVDGSSWLVANGAKCYNAGEINVKAEININGTDFYNCGSVNVTTLRNTSGGIITNFGSIIARDNAEAADSYNCTFINGCYMHYTDHCGIGQIIMLDNSRLDVDGWCEFSQSFYNLDVTIEAADASAIKNATIMAPNIMMRNSVINVGTAFCTNTVFQGPTAADEVAIVKMQKVQLGNGTDISQRNNCYFDWDITEVYEKHPGKGVTTQKINLPNPEAINNVIKTHITKFVQEATSPYTIPAGDCTGAGYHDNGTTPEESRPVPGTGDDPKPMVYSLAFEDMGSIGDFDFNDVVLFVEHDVTSNTAAVKFMAAGGILSVDVKYGDQVLFTKTDGKMTNTSSWGGLIGEKEITMTDPENDLKKFSIVVKENNMVSSVVSSAAVKGEAPQALIIPCGWAWPTERTNIKLAYEQFATWVKDVTNNNWYQYPVDSKCIFPTEQ